MRRGQVVALDGASAGGAIGAAVAAIVGVAGVQAARTRTTAAAAAATTATRLAPGNIGNGRTRGRRGHGAMSSLRCSDGVERRDLSIFLTRPTCVSTVKIIIFVIFVIFLPISPSSPGGENFVGREREHCTPLVVDAAGHRPAIVVNRASRENYRLITTRLPLPGQQWLC